MPYSNSLWMAASLLWILDAANNIALEPYRAFISDKLPEKQYSLGFLMQSFFTGLGTTMANFTPVILVSFGFLALSDKMENGIPLTTLWAFLIGAIASTLTILITVFTTSEYPPTEEEIIKIKKSKKVGILSNTIKEIVDAFKEMPSTMKQLFPVMFFPWYAMFCYWQYLTSALSLSLFDTLDQSSIFFNKAQLLTGNINGTYNIICFSIAFLLLPFAKKFGPKKLHFFSLCFGGIGLMSLPLLSDNSVLFLIPINDGIIISNVYLISFSLGITWASMMSMPYQILANSIPSNKTGIYMGIFNMFIVVPMIIQIFSMQFFVYDLLDKNPISVVQLAGIFLILGGIFTLLIKNSDKS